MKTKQCNKDCAQCKCSSRQDFVFGEDGSSRSVGKGNNSFDNLEWEFNKFKDVWKEKL